MMVRLSLCFRVLCVAVDLTPFIVAMEKALRAAFNLKLIEALQTQYPDVFVKAVTYDGKKNLYTSYKLNFGAQVSRQVESPSQSPYRSIYLKQFDVTWTKENRTSNFKIKMTEAREISMEVLRRYTAGQQSWDENVSTALTPRVVI
ncbi:hypothetical protein F5146DRAFT_171965 [Armillaria mellea]|nr:hypothetical protein F5146DRAFT_171965 [Armillaria mellea]